MQIYRGLVGAALLLLATPTMALEVTATTIGGGPAVRIATIDASNTASDGMFGRFTLLPRYRSLMSDARGAQIRTMQFITYDDEPFPWLGRIITPAGAAEHSGTLVDDPAGGWDYELPGGDDANPFYDSDTENNPATGLPWAYPELSYGNQHSPDGVNPGMMVIADAPIEEFAGDRTLFETFFAYETPSLLSNHVVNLLGGFGWGILGTGDFNIAPIGPTDIAFTDINPAILTELNGALDRSGYAGWNVVADNAILAVPEPATWCMMLSGFSLIAMRSRRSRHQQVGRANITVSLA